MSKRPCSSSSAQITSLVWEVSISVRVFSSSCSENPFSSSSEQRCSSDLPSNIGNGVLKGSLPVLLWQYFKVPVIVERNKSHFGTWFITSSLKWTFWTKQYLDSHNCSFGLLGDMALAISFAISREQHLDAIEKEEHLLLKCLTYCNSESALGTC